MAPCRCAVVGQVAMQGLPPSLLKPPRCNKISPAVEELRRRMQETGAVSMRMPETGMSVDSIMQINAVKLPVRAAYMPYPDEGGAEPLRQS